MSTLEITLLGTFDVTRDGDPITGQMGTTSRALLAYLVANADRPIQRRTVAGLLWPDRPEAIALRSLRSVLSRLRKALKENATQTEGEPRSGCLQVTRHTLRFNEASGCYVDLVRFQKLTAGAARFGDRAETKLSPTELHRYAAATELYRGDFLRGFSCASALFEEWMVVQREAYHLQAMGTLDRLTRHHESEGDHAKVLQTARKVIALDPWCERAHRQVMRALASSGQRAAAIAQYEACQRVLADELNIEPEPQTCELHLQIRRGDLQPQAIEHKDTRAIPDRPVIAPGAGRISRLATASRDETTVEQPDPTEVESERRWVTILLADVITPPELRQDAEVWSEAVDPVLQTISKETGHLRGDILQLRSDGVTATFGTTVAREDDPERAVLAAFVMKQAVAATLTEAGERRLALRISVHRGEAIVSSIGGKLSLISPAMDAARLIHSAVPPNELWVSAGVQRLARSRFEWHVLPPTVADGVEHPATGYRPIRRLRVTDKNRGMAPNRVPLVGRDAELSALRHAIAQTQAGVGGIVTLIGEAGIGKSRLATEARQSTDGVVWVEGRCLSYAEHASYQVWVDLLYELIGTSPGAPATVVRERLQEKVRTFCPQQVEDIAPFLAWMMALPLDRVSRTRLAGSDSEGLRTPGATALHMHPPSRNNARVWTTPRDHRS